MKWLEIDRHHWRRECGRYTVDVAVVQGRERFTAWLVNRQKGGMPTNLGCFDTKATAVACCAAELRSQKVAA